MWSQKARSIVETKQELPRRHSKGIYSSSSFQSRIAHRRTLGPTPFSSAMSERNKADLEAEALMALEKARTMPHGRERTEALRKAGMLQNDVVAKGIIFAKRGRPAKS